MCVGVCVCVGGSSFGVCFFQGLSTYFTEGRDGAQLLLGGVHTSIQLTMGHQHLIGVSQVGRLWPNIECWLPG